MITDDRATHERAMRRTLRLVAGMPFDCSPPWMGQRIHRLLREETGNSDPYRGVKRHSNTLALGLYPTLRRRVRDSVDSLTTAVRLAIAGNVIDFGCRTHVGDGEIHQAIEDALQETSDEAVVEDLRRRVEEAKDILYLTDNAGEIVLDRLLIEQMQTDRVTAVVRGGPVINDATREDAETTGLTSLVTVMDNGSDAPGTILDTCSAEFRDRFARSDLVIAKGQGNYETLGRGDREVVFLLKVKCPVVARSIGCDAGRSLVCHSRPTRQRTSSTVPVPACED